MVIDETNLTDERSWFQHERAKTMIKNLEKRNIHAQYVNNCSEALTAVMAMIGEGETVGFGDSATLYAVGVYAALMERNKNKVIFPLERTEDGSPAVSWDERLVMMREIFFSDVFLTSTNVITVDGKLVNIDGLGNRVAAMIFGPKRVIVVVGVNKIVRDVDEALDRAHEYCGPMNAKRHFNKHQRQEFGNLACVKTGKCIDCSHEYRVCRYTTIIEGTPMREKGKIHVVLVGEVLGI